MDKDNTEPIPVGVKAITLNTIKNTNPTDYKFVMADLFGPGHTDDSRFIDRPKGVPFMFGIGGGINFLEDFQDGNPTWKTAEWVGDPPPEYSIGDVYVENGTKRFVGIWTNPDTSAWVWQLLNGDDEKLSWKTGNKDWKYKIYFPKEITLVPLNNSLNMKGWGVKSFQEDKKNEIPDNLECLPITPNITGNDFENFLILDPERAECKTIVWRKEDSDIEPYLKNKGWVLIDKNIAKGIFVRTKDDMKNKQVTY